MMKKYLYRLVIGLVLSGIISTASYGQSIGNGSGLVSVPSVDTSTLAPSADPVFTGGVDVNLDSTDSMVIDGETNLRGITTGAMRQLHKPSITGTRAKNYVVDTNGFADTKAITVEYTATGLASGDTAAGIDVIVDTANSTGGELDGLHMSSVGTGSVVATVVHANVGTAPIRHDSGAFGAIEQAWDANGGFADVTAAFNSSGTDVVIFSAVDDFIYIGDAATFGDISVMLDTAASGAGIKPTFEFSAGSSTWTAFGPGDGTNGFRIDGVISWTASELSGWATDTVNAVANKYWIRIKRTRNTLTTPPKEDLIQIAAPVKYSWDKDGNLIINSVTTSNTGLHVLDTNASHDLTIVPGSDLTADRILTLTTGDLDRIITLSGDPTLDDWFDQSVKSGDSPTFGSANFTGVGGQFTLARIAGSTFSTIQHLQDIFHSSGWVSDGGITDDADGTITVDAGIGLIRATNNATAEILFTDWAVEAGANVALADNDISYIYVEYNAGSPRVIATTTERTDFNTNILLGLVSRSGTILHINEVAKHVVGDHANAMIRRLKETMPFTQVSGGINSETGTRNIAITIGSFWEGLTPFSTSAFNSSAAGRFSYWYNDGAWQEVATQSAIHQTNYNNFGVGLATLSNNKYGVHWVYLEVDDDVDVIYGQGDYTLSEAENAQPPASVPNRIVTHGFLIGKIIIKKSDAAFTQIESAFQTTFSGSLAQEHGGLAGLADDDHVQYLLADGSRAIDSNAANTSPIYTVENTAGDFQVFRSDATPEGAITGSIGDLCVDGTNGKFYIKETGSATNTGWVETGNGGITLGTEQASTSGTAIDFTSIPAGTKKITIMLVGVSTDGTEELLIQLGDSGGVETGSYTGQAGDRLTEAGSTSGFIVTTTGAAAAAISGSIILTLENSANFTWVSRATLIDTASFANSSAGNKSLSAELDRVRITTTGTPDDFDVGAINIQFE